MRVALVYERFGLGGSLERERVLLARALVAQGVDVHAYASFIGVEVPGVTVHQVSSSVAETGRLRHPWDYARFAIAATRALRRDRTFYDVIDVSGTTAWEHDVVRVHSVVQAELRRWPKRGGRRYRTATIRSAMAPVVRPKLAVARSIERLQLRKGRFAMAVAVAEEVRRDLEDVRGVPAELVEVVPYPVDLDRLAAPRDDQLRRSLGVDEGPLALFVGHEFERKGLTDALESLAGLEGLHLVVVGAGDSEPYRAAARRLGVASRVHFLGRTEEPESLFAAVDLFVLPTLEDVWGISVVEAMAAGLPVVTTDVAGVSGLVAASGAGIVVRSGSVPELREALSVLSLDPAKRQSMGTRGRAAAAGFGLEPHGRAMVKVYERVLQARSGPHG